MGGEVRGRQGVSSSNVMKERNKDVHYSIFSNCLEFFKKKKKSWKQLSSSFLENCLNKLQSPERGRDGSAGTLDGVIWFSPPRTSRENQASKPSRGLGSGFSYYHTFLYILQSNP